VATLKAIERHFSTAIWSALACMGMPLLALGPTVRPLGVRRFARLRRRPQTRRRVPPAPQCGLLAASSEVGAARPDLFPSPFPRVGATAGVFRPNVCRFRNSYCRPTQIVYFSIHKMNWEEASATQRQF